MLPAATCAVDGNIKPGDAGGRFILLQLPPTTRRRNREWQVIQPYQTMSHGIARSEYHPDYLVPVPATAMIAV
jgi:hypothetical protein